MKDKYFYMAVLEKGTDGYWVYFPDFPGCVSWGENVEDAVKNAKEALLLHMYGMEEDNENFPEATKPEVVQSGLSEGECSVFIEVNYRLYREAMNRRSTKCTLTIPQGLYVLAKANNINMSKVLQEALKEQLQL